MRAEAAAEAGTRVASRILQEAQRTSPERILRQTQQAAQYLFNRTQGAGMGSLRVVLCIPVQLITAVRPA